MQVFNPALWVQVPSSEVVPCGGRVSVRSEVLAGLYVLVQNHQELHYDPEVPDDPSERYVLYGVGHEFDFELSFPTSFKVETLTADNFRVWFKVSEATAMAEAPGEEQYTNIDRMPDESGQVMEVRRMLRDFQLRQMAVLAAAREDLGLDVEGIDDEDDTGDAQSGEGIET